MSHEYAARLDGLCRFLDVEPRLADGLVEELRASRLVQRIWSRVEDVPQFARASFTDIESLHLFRTFLYVLVRIRRPAVFVETGVLHGFGSSFILQAMAHNGAGRLVSIDLPHVDGKYAAQGNSLLPQGKQPGWAIPDDLRDRHDLRLGRAEILLPAMLLAGEAPDIFMHDSDHSYAHMALEMSLAWSFLKRGSLMVVDNIEANSSYDDFCRGVGCENTIVVTYPPEHPEYWMHGVVTR